MCSPPVRCHNSIAMQLQAQKAEEGWGREKKALMERLERLQKANKARRAELDDLTAQVQPSLQQVFRQVFAKRICFNSAARAWSSTAGMHITLDAAGMQSWGSCPGFVSVLSL